MEGHLGSGTLLSSLAVGDKVLKASARVNRSQAVASHGGVSYCAVGDVVDSSCSTRKIQAALETQVIVPGTALATS